MSIQPGDTIPSIEVSILREGTEIVNTRELFADRKVVLFAVPGAFTPTCSLQHLPSYIDHIGAFQERDIGVICMSVNDSFVMEAWSKAENVPAGVTMLADGNGAFTKALGLELDAHGFGMGLRAQRFAIYAENGVVKQLHVEDPGEYKVSSAEAMLAAL